MLICADIMCYAVMYLGLAAPAVAAALLVFGTSTGIWGMSGVIFHAMCYLPACLLATYPVRCILCVCIAS